MDEKELEKDILEEDIIEDDEDDDIEFDDNVDFDALSQQLQEHIEIEQGIEDDEENNSQINSMALKKSQNKDEEELTPLDVFPKDICKKYVVHIMPDNIDFVDVLSIDDRNRLINKVIYEQHVVDKKKNAFEERKKYIKHLVVVCLTMILGFPLIFFVVNMSLQASISNYEQSQKNFEKLYKEKGKITNYQRLEDSQ